MAGHNADFGFVGCDDAGAVGTDQPSAYCIQIGAYGDHIQCGQAFCDANNQFDACIRRFNDRIRRKACWHIDDAGVGAGCLDSFGDRVEDRCIANGPFASLARRHTSDHIGAVVDHLLGVKGALTSGDALHNQTGIVVNQDAHALAPFAAATAFSAASAKVAAVGRLASAKI